ncbi:MAG: hypothetical protein QXZ09_03500 [Candidatus Methanomethylicaceae archaeon]
MPASYPSSVKFFSTKVTGQTIEAVHINEPQDEITAIEQGLLQGLQHDLIPDSSDTRSLGSNSRQWLQAVVKRLRVGDSPSTTRIRTIINAGMAETWITVNADYDGTNWNRDDTTKPARAIRINDDKTIDYLYAPLGANPITWSGPQIKVISAGSGLQLQGDPTDSLHAATKQYVDDNSRVKVAKNDVLVGTRNRINFIEGQGVSIAASDDTVNNEVDLTFSAPDDTTIQRVEVAKNGTLAGVRKRINFIEGYGITITASDDTTNNGVDVTVALSELRSRPLLVATSANIPASGGATLVRVDATNETWYELEYPDGSTTVADFEISALAFSQIRFVWRTPGTSGACRWAFYVREKGNGDVLGGGTVVASGAINDAAPGTANQLKEATVNVSYTPGTNKRCAILRVSRIGGDAADTLASPARLIWAELLL